MGRRKLDGEAESPKRGRKPTKEELKAARVAIWTVDRNCPLCGREMIEGPSLNEHHLIPRSYGGVERHVMHRVCHSKIHSVYTEAELAHVHNTFESLRRQPEIAKFIKWVRKQDALRIVKHRRPRRT